MCLCDRLLVTKSLKIQFKMASLLSCLFCVDTTLIYFFTVLKSVFRLFINSNFISEAEHSQEAV